MLNSDSDFSNVRMAVTLLGTGTPNPKVDQWGPSIIIQIGNKYTLFDCGRGTLLRVKQAEINPAQVSNVFLTHLHSDHVVGLPDLWLTGWELGRDEPLRLWGPKGIVSMSFHLKEAFSADISGRQAPPERLYVRGAKIEATEIENGETIVNNGLKVTAFQVDHGSFKPAIGYRVDYDGYSVVLSGDTRYSENLVKHSRDADILIHDAWVAPSGSVALQLVASPEEAARAFTETRPRLSVISHYNTDVGLEERIRAVYNGDFIIGKDLMRIEIKSGGKISTTSSHISII
jgi:ribonuclease Z